MTVKRTRRKPMRKLVRVLRGIQHNEQLSTESMARRLGISPSMLGMVYHGQRNPGPKFLRGVLLAYPQLGEEVRRYLLRERADRG
jgi:transcriptional regulator with XRE-family HTH domain